MAKLDKYNKNMAQGGISLETQEKLITSSVLVMGVGALGSGVVMNLAALGVGKIKLVDNAIVEEDDFNSQLIHKYKNLNRAKVMSAKDWIQEFNPDIKVELDKARLDEFNYHSVIQGYDIIVDCFNSIEMSLMLNEIALRHGKTLVYGSTKALKGFVTTIVPNESACLNCIEPKPDFPKKSENNAVLAPVASVVSSLQANEVMKFLTQSGTPLTNKLLTFDAKKSEFSTFYYSKSSVCATCKTQPINAIETPIGPDLDLGITPIEPQFGAIDVDKTDNDKPFDFNRFSF